MTTENTTKENKGAESKPESKSSQPTRSNDSRGPARKSRFGSRQGGKGRPGGKRGRGRRPERPKPDFDQKIVSIRRVTRVMAGGRRFSFSVAMIIGDKKGRVGVGLGKANDTALAIQKAINDAKKNMIKLRLTDTHSIDYGVRAKYSSGVVALRPNHGRGVVAGSAVRTVLELAGIKDITAKIIGRTKNRLNNANAVIKALEPFVVKRGLEAARTKKPALQSEGKAARS